MRRLKKILDSWNELRHRMRNQDEAQEVKAKPSFPTIGIIGAIAGDCFGAAYEFNPVKSTTSTYVSYLEANSYTAAIRNAISLGGDADTMACMAGGIAIATKGMEMPEDLAYYIYNHVLDDYLRHVLYEFNQLSPL